MKQMSLIKYKHAHLSLIKHATLSLITHKHAGGGERQMEV